LPEISKTAALCCLCWCAKWLAKLQGTGGKVIKTSLTHEQEEKMQAALSTAKGSAVAG
jgi:uncharacterized membrane protein